MKTKQRSLVRKTGLFLGVFWLFTACNTYISSSISNPLAPTPSREEIMVFGLEDTQPVNAKVLGTVKIGDNGFTTNCSFPVVIEQAKNEARKAGGNAIKIIQHRPPSSFGSSCHRITATILRVEGEFTVPGTAREHPDCALLHIYRTSGTGSLISYDVYLDDVIVCRSENNSKETVIVRYPGTHTIWARTESRVDLPLDIEMGKDYYIRCGISIGLVVGRPTLDVIGNQYAEIELQGIKSKNSSGVATAPKEIMSDKILLKDGTEIICKITGEDQESYFLTMNRKGQLIETSLHKSAIKEIYRGFVR